MTLRSLPALFYPDFNRPLTVHPPTPTPTPPPAALQLKQAQAVNAALRAFVTAASDPLLHYCGAGEALPPDLFPGRWVAGWQRCGFDLRGED